LLKGRHPLPSFSGRHLRTHKYRTVYVHIMIKCLIHAGRSGGRLGMMEEEGLSVVVWLVAALRLRRVVASLFLASAAVVPLAVLLLRLFG